MIYKEYWEGRLGDKLSSDNKRLKEVNGLRMLSLDLV